MGYKILLLSLCLCCPFKSALSSTFNDLQNAESIAPGALREDDPRTIRVQQNGAELRDKLENLLNMSIPYLPNKQESTPLDTIN